MTELDIRTIIDKYTDREGDVFVINNESDISAMASELLALQGKSKHLTDEDIELHIWEEIYYPLCQRDIEQNTEYYRIYQTVIKWVKWCRDYYEGKEEA